MFEKDRLISFFGRDLHKLVTNTEPHLWRESVKALYRTYAKKGAAEMDGGDDEQVDQEFTLQRHYMERALGALKTRVGRTEEKTQQDFQKKVGENTMLIKECNALRTDNKDLKYQNAQLHTELQQQSRSGAQAPLRRQPSAGALRPSTAGRLASESLPSMRADSGGARGQLLKGSASVSGRERAKMAEMLVAQVCFAALATTWALHASWPSHLTRKMRHSILAESIANRSRNAAQRNPTVARTGAQLCLHPSSHPRRNNSRCACLPGALSSRAFG